MATSRLQKNATSADKSLMARNAMHQGSDPSIAYDQIKHGKYIGPMITYKN